ncbi:MAG: STAS domain-containing protein [Acidimicrobiia bacterium]
MPGTPFAAVSRSQGNLNIIDLTGDIDRNAKEAMEAAYAELEGGGPVVLNFTDVDYINSTGIAVIVGLLARARADGRALRAWGLSPHYREIFQITRLADFMTIYDTEPAALAVD